MVSPGPRLDPGGLRQVGWVLRVSLDSSVCPHRDSFTGPLWGVQLESGFYLFLSKSFGVLSKIKRCVVCLSQREGGRE